MGRVISDYMIMKEEKKEKKEEQKEGKEKKEGEGYMSSALV